MKLILASNNKKKLVEMRDILSEMGIEVLSQREAGLELEVEENGTTFAENAYLKAKGACDALGIPAVADDSGLEVDALGGEPGIYSARYAGENATDRELYELLLRNMEEKEDRRARFVSSIACVFPNGDVVRAEGYCSGEILYEPKGENGFGYDPVFFLPEYQKTMAEVTPQEKNAVSHRGNALKEFKKELENYFSRKQ